MKRKSKLVSMFLVVILVCELIPVNVIAESINPESNQILSQDNTQTNENISNEIDAEKKENNLIKSSDGLLFRMKDQGLTIIGFEDPMKNNIPTTELVIPDYFEDNKIIEISVKAFKEQKNILTVLIPATILFIDATAFEGCTNLEKIEVDQQNAVYFSKNGILHKKENKTEYIVPENLKSDNKEIAIDEKSMANPSSIQATKMQEASTTDFQYELINNNTEVKIISYLGSETDVTVPELIEGKPVTELYGYIGGKNSEYHPVFNENVLRIKIPKTIKTINEYAFQGKTSPEYIDVDPQNKNFISQEGVLYTTDYKVLIYYPCKKEGKNYEVLEGVEKITGGAFRNASKLEKIILPKSLKTISNNSFSNCAALQSIKTSSEYIGEFAFAYCENLSTVQLVEGLKEIDDYAFRKVLIFQIVWKNCVIMLLKIVFLWTI